MGSILDNILIGNQSASDEHILKVLKLANANFVLELEDRLETLVGFEDRGVQLTLSQQHRIVLARALISDPRLILLDDITEGLDPTGLCQVQTAINNILKLVNENQDMTVVVVTQSVNTIEQT